MEGKAYVTQGHARPPNFYHIWTSLSRVPRYHHQISQQRECSSYLGTLQPWPQLQRDADKPLLGEELPNASGLKRGSERELCLFYLHWSISRRPKKPGNGLPAYGVILTIGPGTGTAMPWMRRAWSPTVTSLPHTGCSAGKHLGQQGLWVAADKSRAGSRASSKSSGSCYSCLWAIGTHLAGMYP